MKVSNIDEVSAAIAAIDKKFMEDVNRGDAAAGAAAYTDDAILMPPNHSPLEGKQAIEKYLAEIIKGSPIKGQVKRKNTSP